LKNDFQQTKMI